MIGQANTSFAKRSYYSHEEQNKAVVRRLYHDAAVGRAEAVGVSPDGFAQYTLSGRRPGLDTFNRFFAAVRAAMPDFQLTIGFIVAQGDKVMARYTVEGTQTGEFMGVAATGTKTRVTGIDVFRLDEEHVIEHWDAAHQLYILGHMRKASKN